MDKEKLSSNPINIIYLTTECNFKCSYCYENQKNNEKKIYATKEEIETFVDNIVKNSDPNIDNYTVCLMGGEPFLAIEQMRYFMEYIKKYPHKTFACNVASNGSLIHLYIDDIKKWMLQRNAFFGLDISYDGSFQYQRSKSDITERNMKLLMDNNILFGISYTITEASRKNNAYLKDIIMLSQKYYSNFVDGSRQRFRINIDHSSLPPEEKDSFKNKLTEQCLYLYSKLHISMCYFSCKFCQRCKFVNTGRNYTIPSIGTKIEKIVTDNKFNHF